MQIHNDINAVNKIKNAVVTTGTFDGVHLGHKKIIDRIRSLASNSNGETVIVTFYPHPRMVLFPDDNDLRLLNTPEEKNNLLQKMGVDHLVVIPFNKEFSRTTSLEFVRNVLVNKIGVKKLVIGYNHHFGRNREGGIEQLREFSQLYHFDVEEIPALDVDEIEVSSTKIRNAIINGDLQTACSFLGYDYFISGEVIKGKQLGRTIGFPTANINISYKYKLLPPNGVYAVKANLKGKAISGMMNIGMNPTVNALKKSIEVHLFDFNEDIYGEIISVSFIKKIRDEVKFESVDLLKAQLLKDKEKTLQLI